MYLKREKYVGKEVVVSVPHHDSKISRPFYIYATVVDVEEKDIVLENEKGLQKILLSEVLQIIIRNNLDGGPQ